MENERLTKREQLVFMIAAGLAANPKIVEDEETLFFVNDYWNIGRMAIVAADRVLKELNEEIE